MLGLKLKAVPTLAVPDYGMMVCSSEMHILFLSCIFYKWGFLNFPVSWNLMRKNELFQEWLIQRTVEKFLALAWVQHSTPPWRRPSSASSECRTGRSQVSKGVNRKDQIRQIQDEQCREVPGFRQDTQTLQCLGLGGLRSFLSLIFTLLRLNPMVLLQLDHFKWFVAICQYRGIYFVHDHFSMSLELLKKPIVRDWLLKRMIWT